MVPKSSTNLATTKRTSAGYLRGEAGGAEQGGRGTVGGAGGGVCLARANDRRTTAARPRPSRGRRAARGVLQVADKVGLPVVREGRVQVQRVGRIRRPAAPREELHEDVGVRPRRVHLHERSEREQL